MLSNLTLMLLTYALACWRHHEQRSGPTFCAAVDLSSASAEMRASATVATQEESSAAKSNGGQTSHSVSSREEEADAALLTWAAPSDTISSRRSRQSLHQVKGISQSLCWFTISWPHCSNLRGVWVRQRFLVFIMCFDAQAED